MIGVRCHLFATLYFHIGFMIQSAFSRMGRSFSWLGLLCLGAITLLLSVSATQVSAQDVQTGFDQIYEAAGKPRVIVFVNEDFATLLSDWSLEHTASNDPLAEDTLLSGFARPRPLSPTDPKGVDDFHDR